ncbi:hypothetical protein GE09DRAFT_99333 [Coniochaeta sp. 2T2.1]|nr:hypothetical protein GE09DRAFT_99333 [Coniochaeta sp. 2T2.1]
MEDSKELIDELLARLADLDTKVASYRQEMLDQFQKFADELLKGVPEEVSNEVSRAIAESMAKYPALGGMPSRAAETASSSSSREGRKSPPPILYHTSGIPKMLREGFRSPHEREVEFQGLFTPSYLPLLDGNDRREPRINPESRLRKAVPDPVPEPYEEDEDEPPVQSRVAEPDLGNIYDVDNDDDAAVVEMVEEVEVGEGAAQDNNDKGKGKEVVRPSASREMTDASISSSVGSSSSEQKTRRSALRRSSSSARGSPRRVRFEFEGTEVLPTASPRPGSPLDLDAPESTSAVDDSEEYTGSSLIDVEGEEDDHPRPARISSTDALRRLTRTPSDDGTVWNVVQQSDPAVPHTNGTGSSGTGPSSTVSQAEAASTFTSTPVWSQMATPSADETQSQGQAPVNGMRVYHDTATPATTTSAPSDDEFSDEGYMEMKKSPKKSPSPTVASPKKPLSPAAIPAFPKSPLSSEIGSQLRKDTSGPSASSEGKGSSKNIAQRDDEEDVFKFEDEVAGAGSTKADKYLPDEPEEEEEQRPARREEPESKTPLSLYSTSPAISIPGKSPSPTGAAGGGGGGSSKAFTESIGSYKGGSLKMNVVRDLPIARAAAAMGDVKTYVGSVHGRTGIDPADESSYRASFTNARIPSGTTPRSLSERMMMEEAMGQRARDHQVRGQEARAQPARGTETVTQRARGQETRGHEARGTAARGTQATGQMAQGQSVSGQQVKPQQAPPQQATGPPATVQQAPAQQAPAEQAPAPQAPAQQAPAQQVPVQQAQAPAQQAPAQQAMNQQNNGDDLD